MDQAIQVVGAVLILVAFAANQRGLMGTHEARYLWPNFLGSAILAGIALHNGDIGFLLLEGIWSIVSAWGLVQLARGRTPGGGSPA